MVSLSMTLSDPWPGFQGHGSFKRRISPKRRILQTRLLYRTLIGNHRQAIDRQGKLAIQLTTPLLLHKPFKRFASVARVCQRQLAFLVKTTSKIWGPPPPKKNCGRKKHAFFGAISDDFALRSRISPERNKISTTGKRRCKLQSLSRLLT